jgi:hypothetical protein
MLCVCAGHRVACGLLGPRGFESPSRRFCFFLVVVVRGSLAHLLLWVCGFCCFLLFGFFLFCVLVVGVVGWCEIVWVVFLPLVCLVTAFGFVVLVFHLLDVPE